MELRGAPEQAGVPSGLHHLHVVLFFTPLAFRPCYSSKFVFRFGYIAFIPNYPSMFVPSPSDGVSSEQPGMLTCLLRLVKSILSQVMQLLAQCLCLACAKANFYCTRVISSQTTVAPSVSICTICFSCLLNAMHVHSHASMSSLSPS